MNICFVFQSVWFVHFQNSVDDEFVISTARKCNKCTDKLVIFDARSMFAAGGNMLKVRYTLCSSLRLFFLTSSSLVPSQKCFSRSGSKWFSGSLFLANSTKCLLLFSFQTSKPITDPTVV